MPKVKPHLQKMGIGDSLNKKHMINNRNNMEQHIQLKHNFSNFSFWWNNLLGEGQLAQFSTNSHCFNNRKVPNFWVNGQWIYQLLIQKAQANELAKILAITIPQNHIPEQAYWKTNSNGISLVLYFGMK